MRNECANMFRRNKDQGICLGMSVYVCISFKPFQTVVSQETDMSLKSRAFVGWTPPVLTGGELLKLDSSNKSTS